MARPIQITFPAADADGICLAQTTAGATPLIINGALKDLPATMQQVTRAVMGAGIERPVTLTVAAANLSGIDFTIVGTDVEGADVSEVLAGPSSNTVSTTALYNTVTSITPDGAVGTAVSAGSGTTGNTAWVMSNVNISPANLSVSVAVTTTANVTVQDTPADVQAGAPTSAEIFNHPTLAALAGSAEGNYAYPARYVRAVMNSSSGSGAFTLTVIQAGIA
jgi:hypothetical protein